MVDGATPACQVQQTGLDRYGSFVHPSEGIPELWGSFWHSLGLQIQLLPEDSVQSTAVNKACSLWHFPNCAQALAFLPQLPNVTGCFCLHRHHDEFFDTGDGASAQDLAIAFQVCKRKRGLLRLVDRGQAVMLLQPHKWWGKRTRPSHRFPGVVGKLCGET